MQFDILTEFVVYTQFMNLSKAADKLHMSQPNLSKHLKQLEAEVGFKLFKRNSQHSSLTPAGELFLASISEILDNYTRTIEACKNISQKPSTSINAMQHYYNDEGSRKYYSLLYKFKNQNPNLSIHYSNPYREDSLTRLRNKEVDIIIHYSIGPLVFPDLYTRHLSKVQLGVFCPINSFLAEKNSLSLSDITNAFIFRPNDANIPFYNALDKLCEQENIRLNYRIASTCTQTEFYSLEFDNSCFIIPYEMRNDQRICVQDNRTVIPLDAYLDEYMIWRKEDLGDFASYLLALDE